MREKHQLVASRTHPDRGPNLQPRPVPNWESNSQPFGLQDDAQPTEPHWPGLSFLNHYSEGLLKINNSLNACFSPYILLAGMS